MGMVPQTFQIVKFLSSGAHFNSTVPLNILFLRIFAYGMIYNLYCDSHLTKCHPIHSPGTERHSLMSHANLCKVKQQKQSNEINSLTSTVIEVGNLSFSIKFTRLEYVYDKREFILEALGHWNLSRDYSNAFSVR